MRAFMLITLAFGVFTLSNSFADGLERLIERKDEMQELADIIRSAPVAAEYEWVFLVYHRKDDPGVVILSREGDVVELEDQRPGVPITMVEGEPTYPRRRGTLITGENGTELIESKTTFDVRLIEYGDDILVERGHGQYREGVAGPPGGRPVPELEPVGIGKRLVVRNGKRKFQHFTTSGRLLREMTGDGAPEVRRYTPFTAYGYAAQLRRAYEAYDWGPASVTERNTDDGIELEVRDGATPYRTRVSDDGALMIRSWGDPEAGDSVTYRGQQDLIGMKFPTERELITRELDGTLKTRQLVRNIRLRIADPGEVEEELDSWFND